MLLSKLFKNKVVDERIGYAFMTEILPVFHNRVKETNKTIWVVTKIIKDDLAEATYFEHGVDIEVEVVDLSDEYFLSQNGVPIKYNKKGMLSKYNSKFSKNGYEIGQVYKFKNMGYLGNINSFYEVLCVLDNGVLFSTYPNEKYAGIYFNSFSELERINPVLKL